MNSRQIEEEFAKEVAFIQNKVSLGELSLDEGDFLTKHARAKADRELSRLKRPSWVIYYVLTTLIAIFFVICFSLTFNKLGAGFYFPLFGLFISTLCFLAILKMEIKRLEDVFSQFFSKALLKKLLNAPKIEFEWQLKEALQIHLSIKNESNLYAGLKENEICELKTHILDCVNEVFDDGDGIIEFVGDNNFIICYLEPKESIYIVKVLRNLKSLFNNLRSHDGEWYAKSIRMGAGVVFGEFSAGTIGHNYKVFRLFGEKRVVGEALAEASGWEEVYLDEAIASDIDKWTYTNALEPIFLKDSKKLIRVYRLNSFKDN